MRVDGCFLLLTSIRMGDSMKAVGIIAEFNPLHSGHRYVIEEARKQSGADVVIVAMSGQLMQRGSIAFVDQQIRTKWALEAGADLVIQQPVWASLQATDYFARAGVETLRLAGCLAYAFGSEVGDSSVFRETVDLLEKNRDEIDGYMKHHALANLGYAENFETAVSRLKDSQKSIALLRNPNAQLGLAYCLSNSRLTEPMDMIVIQRQSKHDSLSTEKGVSGSKIRHIFKMNNSKEIIKKYPIWDWISENQFQTLERFGKIIDRSLYDHLQWQLLVLTPKQISSYYGVDEGIEYRLIKVARLAKTYEEWLESVKHKRITTARTRRMALCIVFGLTKSQMLAPFSRPTSKRRVLGFSPVGRTYLKEKQLPYLTTQYKLFSDDFQMTDQVDLLLSKLYPDYYKTLEKPVQSY